MLKGQSGIANQVINRNIRSLLEVRQRHHERGTRDERLAIWISSFIGSLPFIYLNLAFVASWMSLNLGAFGVKPFDPYPFVFLSTIASVEAIFLATFMLLGQNRMNKLAEKRADLDVQISLLTEHELTQLIRLTDAVARHLGVVAGEVKNLDELKKDVVPQALMEQIERQEEDFEGT